MELKNIKWEYGVAGHLSEKEWKFCEPIEAIICAINKYGHDISVQVSIENGNKWHILNGNKWVTGYLDVEVCRNVLFGMYLAVKELKEDK